MFLFRSFKQGIRNVWSSRFLVGLMYFFKLVSSLVVLFPLYIMFSVSFGANLKASNLLSGSNLSLLIDFAYYWRKTLPIYLATFVLACVIVILAFIFLSGGFWGILRDGAIRRDGHPRLEGFFGYCGKYFWGMFKVTALLGVFYFFAFLVLLFCSAALDAMGLRAHLWELTSGRIVARLLIAVPLFFFVNMIGDYLRIFLIEKRDDRFFGIVGKALKFVLTNVARTLSLYYFLSLVSAVAILVYVGLIKALDATPPIGLFILVGFLLQQMFILFRSFYRLVYYSCELSLYRNLWQVEARAG